MHTDPERIFFESIDFLIKLARRMIVRSYENAHLFEQNLWYHCLAHTEGVQKRAMKIVTVCNEVLPATFNPRERALVSLAAYYHDVYIASYIKADADTPHLRLVRRRMVGASEKASVAILHRHMLETNKDHEREIFSAADREYVRRTILLTVPRFEYGTVVQPIKEEMPLHLRILPLADLGVCGMEPSLSRRDSDLLLCEEQPSVQAAILGKSGDEQYIRQDILEWGFNQMHFIAGRQQRTLVDLKGLPQNLAMAIREQCFPQENFNISFKQERESYVNRTKMSYVEIMRDMRSSCQV